MAGRYAGKQMAKRAVGVPTAATINNYDNEK